MLAISESTPALVSLHRCMHSGCMGQDTSVLQETLDGFHIRRGKRTRFSLHPHGRCLQVHIGQGGERSTIYRSLDSVTNRHTKLTVYGTCQHNVRQHPLFPETGLGPGYVGGVCAMQAFPETGLDPG